MVATFSNTQYDTGIDLILLSKIAEHFRTVADRLKSEGFIDPKVLSVDTNTLLYQVPGGMLSNLISQLKQSKAENRLLEVLQEVPRVRFDLGYPPLVTPASQIVGTQAVLNVISGGRYKIVTNETKDLLRGEYGRLPAPVNEEIRKQIIGDDPIIDYRPADKIPPEVEKYRHEMNEYYEKEEDILTYALFPQIATKFFQARLAKKYKLDYDNMDTENNIHPV